ncbi:serine/arginine repetitive matrix protein 2 [Drosophila sechellia]|uniref:serine/arginine repetitive matrix protein 2 n=1 Tax=Drosophila sechellia TaxID=7238 RepID=UPI0013DE3B37|nr:serine/arginine repetitive matrix protein 2 [Drosophila sechellia]
MHQSIWSAPQVGGSGGALKALARNVANHLKLNRSNMKRVVAQVVAEHHTLGEVADYKGHMYFAKPDRLNFHELIAQSKEAFDDLLLHEPRSAKKQAITKRSKYPTNPNVKLQMTVSPPQLEKPQKKQSTIKKPGLPKKHSRPKIGSRKKSSTTIFQLADAGRRSLNGVIIDETHLPLDGEQREILLHVPPSLVKRSRRRLRSAQTKDTSEKCPPQKPDKDPDQKKTGPQKDGEKITEEKILQVQKRQPEKKRSEEPKPVTKMHENHQKELIRSPSRPRSGSPSVPQARRSPSPVRSQKVTSVRKASKALRSPPHKTINVKNHALNQRIKAGDTKMAISKPAEKKKSRSMLRTVKKKTLPQRSYDKPWILKRSQKRRLSAGGSQLKKNLQRPMNSDVKRKEKSGKGGKIQHSARSTKVEQTKISAQIKPTSHVGRQMQRVNFPWYTPYQFQGAAGATQIPNAGVAIPPCQLLKEKSRKLTQRLSVTQPISQMKRPNITSRQRHNLRMRERLIRDLQREEDIDDPLSNGSGVLRRARGGMQPSQQIKEPEQPKKEQDHRSVERVSSRIKRLPKGRRYRQPIATSERIMIPPPKVNNNNNNNNKSMSPSRPNFIPRVRRRFRSVLVDSSLGSIALMGQPVQSKQTLTPAKRHLTIAFMNKRSERTNAAVQPWK